ncbi:hypothetical protein IIC45_01030 [Patescibacteria group bacterium]|nr:hypothetical protein [Patescibacteria group bacterium]
MTLALLWRYDNFGIVHPNRGEGGLKAMSDENGSDPNPYDFKEAEIGGEIFHRVFLKRDRESVICTCPDGSAAVKVVDGLGLLDQYKLDQYKDEEIMNAGEVVRTMFGRPPHETDTRKIRKPLVLNRPTTK